MMMKRRLNPSPSASNISRMTGQAKESNPTASRAAVSKATASKSSASSKQPSSGRSTLSTSKSVSSHNIRMPTPNRSSGQKGPSPASTGPSSAVNKSPAMAEETGQPDFDDLPPAPLIRSNSYTIRRHDDADGRAQSPPMAANAAQAISNTEAGSGRVAQRPVSSDHDYRPLIEKPNHDYRSHIGKPVLANGQLGILRYFGPVHCLDGLFCGIEFDKPIGLHDGQIAGTRYFQTRFKHATFCPVEHVRIADTNGLSKGGMASAWCPKPMYTVEGELLTEVEPNLLEKSMDDSLISNQGGAGHCDLTSSLLFLKGSRLSGMDVSMTPSELLGQLFSGSDAEASETPCTEKADTSTWMDMHDDHFPVDGTLQVTPTSDLMNSTLRPTPTGRAFDSGICDPVIRPTCSSGTEASVLRDTVTGFDAMTVVVKYYVEQIIPGLQNELDRSRRTIDEFTTSQLNQENENRLLRDHYGKAVDRVRQCDQKLQRVRAEYQKAENDWKATTAQKKADAIRFEKMAKDYFLEITSLNEVADIRNKEISDLRQKCNAMEEDMSKLCNLSNDLSNYQRLANKMEWKVATLEKTLQQKTFTESEMKNKILSLEKQILERNLTVQKLLMNNREFKDTPNSMYVSPNDLKVLPSGKNGAFNLTAINRRRSRSLTRLDA